MLNFAITAKSVVVNSINSGVSGPNVTKIVGLHNVEKFIPFNPLKSESVSEWHHDKVDWSGEKPIFQLYLVAMATSLDKLKKS